MKFEVVNSLGNTVMSTMWETCVYDEDDLRSLYKAGYRFKVDGKFVNVGKVLSAVHESFAKSGPPKEEFDPAHRPAPTSKSSNVQASEGSKANGVTADTDSGKDESSDNDKAAETPVIENAKPEAGKSDKPKGEGRTVIRCKETGQTWDKQSHAAKELHIDAAQVSDSIKTGRPRSGYTFEKVVVYDE